MENSQQRIAEIFISVIFEPYPNKVIPNTTDIPPSVPKEHYDYWHLQFKLKWDNNYINPEKLKPQLDELIWAFEQIRETNLPIEAQYSYCLST